MGKHSFSGQVAGTTAAVIWISFCLGFGWTNLKLVGWIALVFLVVGWIGTAAIATVISKQKAAGQGG